MSDTTSATSAVAPGAEQFSGVLDSVSRLLQVTPLGLGAIVLAAVGITLMWPGEIQENRSKLLRLFMYLGGFSTIVGAVIFFFTAPHMVTLVLQPPSHDQSIPEPTIQVQNGKIVPYGQPFSVDADITVVVDLKAQLQRYDAQVASINQLNSSLQTARTAASSYQAQTQTLATRATALEAQLNAQSASLTSANQQYLQLKTMVDTKAPLEAIQHTTNALGRALPSNF